MLVPMTPPPMTTTSALSIEDLPGCPPAVVGAPRPGAPPAMIGDCAVEIKPPYRAI
jgi:hypothetical protein